MPTYPKLPLIACVFALLSLASFCDEETPFAPCDGVTCSDRGECVLDDASPQCECEPGFEPWGLSCVPEGGLDGDGDLDQPAVDADSRP